LFPLRLPLFGRIGDAARAHGDAYGDVVCSLRHVAGLAGRPGCLAEGAVECAVQRGLPHLPLLVIRSHVAFGARCRIADNLQVGVVVGVARGTVALDAVTVVAPDLAISALCFRKRAHWTWESGSALSLS